MKQEITTETSPYQLVAPDGSRRVWKTRFLRVTDVHMTAFGPWDRGYTQILDRWTEVIPAPPKAATKPRWLGNLIGWLA